MPGVYSCDVVGNEKIAESIYAMTITCPDIADTACAGQFVSIKCSEAELLRRPISICSIDSGELKLVYEVKGVGTRWLSSLAVGSSIDVLGPLGKGFTIPESRTLLVGGGIGTPPLLFAAKVSKQKADALLGFRDRSRIILKGEFEGLCENVIIATDDGSSGFHGNVAEPLAELLENGGYGAVLACGPVAMLSAVAGICARLDIPCQVSLEERMACGVGACYVCACATVKDGAASMSRVCKEGPVFDAGEVDWSGKIK